MQAFARRCQSERKETRRGPSIDNFISLPDHTNPIHCDGRYVNRGFTNCRTGNTSALHAVAFFLVSLIE